MRSAELVVLPEGAGELAAPREEAERLHERRPLLVGEQMGAKGVVARLTACGQGR
jgi:hypothetical protein